MKAVDPFQDGGRPEPVRRPGDFRRHPYTGAPYVTHPTETTKRTGTKAELLAECAAAGIDWRSDLDIDPGKTPTVAQLQHLLGPRPVQVQYGRPSSLGKQIEDQTNLQKWSERMVALGVGKDDNLRADVAHLPTLDPDSPEFRDAADKIARRAKTAAQAMLAAERGTHHHELTEDVDNDRDPVERMAAGEELGVPVAEQHALIAAWSKMLVDYDIEILATEAACVDDEWRVAGTLDRICRLRRDLRFVLANGEIVTLKAGTVLILDIKTGRLRLDRNGFVAYWHGYSVQVASYAKSKPYDVDTDTRGEWPWPIDQRWAIIAHLDVLAALDGEAVCRLVLVDLEAGRHAGDLCVAAKSWEKRTDVFSLPVEDMAVRIKVAAPAPTPPVTAPSPGGDLPTPSAGEGPAQHTPTPAEQQDAVRSRPTPAEGDDVDDGTYAPLKARYDALDAAGRSWIKRIAEQAMQGGVSFHMATTRTVRRYSIFRSLVILAELEADDEAVRALLELVIGDVAHFPAVPLGLLVGSLDVHEAGQFGHRCDDFLADALTLTYLPDGTARAAAA